MIQVLGTGCTKCKTLYEIVKKAVAGDGRRGPGREGRGHSEDHGLRDSDDARPGHQRRSQDRRSSAERRGSQEADSRGQGSLTTECERKPRMDSNAKRRKSW